MNFEWIFMNFRSFSMIFVHFRGFPRISTDFHGFTHFPGTLACISISLASASAITARVGNPQIEVGLKTNYVMARVCNLLT